MFKHILVMLLMLFFMTCHRIPHKIINHQSVDLSSKQLKAFPMEVLSYKGVKHLQLGVKSVMIYSMQPSMIVTESANKIQSLPTNIDRLQDLELLDLSFNKIKKLPKGFYNLKKLESLDLSYNKEIPINQIEALQTLPNLKKLYLIGIITNAQDSLHIKETFFNTQTHVFLNWSDLNE